MSDTTVPANGHRLTAPPVTGSPERRVGGDPTPALGRSTFAASSSAVSGRSVITGIERDAGTLLSGGRDRVSKCRKNKGALRSRSSRGMPASIDSRSVVPSGSMGVRASSTARAEGNRSAGSTWSIRSTTAAISGATHGANCCTGGGGSFQRARIMSPSAET